jgi:hypothetical protein
MLPQQACRFGGTDFERMKYTRYRGGVSPILPVTMIKLNTCIVSGASMLPDQWARRQDVRVMIAY